MAISVESPPPARAPGTAWHSWLMRSALYANFALAACIVWAYVSFGSIRSALEFARGQRLVLETRSRSIGNVKPGSQLEITFNIANRGPQPVRIVGCGMACIGRAINDLPMLVEPRGTRPFAIRLVMHRRPGAFEMPVILYTNDPAEPELTLTISGTVDQATREPRPL